MRGEVHTALLSAFDKRGLVDFARGLAGHDVALLSSGGTARTLREAGLEVTEIADYTGAPEMMDGRVKTLHPKVHGGILAVRDNVEHIRSASEHGIRMIDLVAVNLYPFQQTLAKPGATEEEIIEMIDVGGPSMLRAAAKNHAYVTVVPTPDDYSVVLSEMKRTGGVVRDAVRRRFAARTFELLSQYDTAVAQYLGGATEEFPELLTLPFRKKEELRYGENPHQRAAVYVHPEETQLSVAHAHQRGGKTLSYNNLLDTDSALRVVLEFDTPACVIVKHNTPCGAATHPEPVEAFRRALAGDPQAAFGGVVACNRPVDVTTAEAMTDEGTFFEVILAPAFDAAGLGVLQTRPKWGKSVRVLELPFSAPQGLEFRSILGGLLAQTPDDLLFTRLDSATTPATPEQRRDLLIAWRLVKHAKSNAIVLVKGGALVGVGAGEVSRVRAAEIAVHAAGDRARGSVAASDAFFPFPDGVEALARAGIVAIIQPGGSKRDDEVFEAAQRHGIPMVLTGVRHFRH